MLLRSMTSVNIILREGTIMATRASRAKAAPVQEPDEDEFEDMGDEVEVEDDDEDLEELEEAEEPETPVKSKGRSNKGIEAARKARDANAPEFGSAWLAAHVTEVTGEKYDGRAVRMLLRKLASSGKLDRTVGETRDRYSFTGKTDPVVKLVVEMVTSGEAKKLKQEGLQKVKDQAAAKKAAAAKAKAAAAEEDEAEEDDDDEDVEEAPAPKPTRTRRTAAKPATATPAKATPAKATTRRRAAATQS